MANYKLFIISFSCSDIFLNKVFVKYFVVCSRSYFQHGVYAC